MERQPVGIKAHLPPVDIARQTRRYTARNQEQARDRLQARYDESARAAFQAGYDRELNHWQSMIDQVGQRTRCTTPSRRFTRSVASTTTLPTRSRSSTSSR